MNHFVSKVYCRFVSLKNILILFLVSLGNTSCEITFVAGDSVRLSNNVIACQDCQLLSFFLLVQTNNKKRVPRECDLDSSRIKKVKSFSLRNSLYYELKWQVLYLPTFSYIVIPKKIKQ